MQASIGRPLTLLARIRFDRHGPCGCDKRVRTVAAARLTIVTRLRGRPGNGQAHASGRGIVGSVDLMIAARSSREGRIIAAHRPAMGRSAGRRLGARSRERLRVRSLCLTSRASATIERTPPSVSDRKTDQIRWTSSVATSCMPASLANRRQSANLGSPRCLRYKTAIHSPHRKHPQQL